jgi:hypothetical protein
MNSFNVVDARAPAERLAAFRVITGVFALGYLLIRLGVFLELGHRSGTAFDSVGVLAGLSTTLSPNTIFAIVVVTVVAGIGYTTGSFFRLTGPVFAIGMLLLTTYRGSWGQLLHFENLMVLHLLIVAVSPATDAWSFDASRVAEGERREDEVAYGWPLALAGMIVVLTYVISGFAKLRYGGLQWVFGDTLRNHIAYSTARLDLVGATRPPIAEYIVDRAWIFPPMAATAVVLELAAPIAFVRGRPRDIWVAAAWTMHVSIFATMLIAFPYPLFGVAFAPFYRLERLAQVPMLWYARGRGSERLKHLADS